jgi:hypothetical protein
LKRLGITTAAALAAVVLFLLATLPPSPRQFPLAGAHDELQRRTVRGAFHIHTTRSDGAGSVEDVAAAASRAGLQFAIITDHGDGTRPPDPPRYLDGVLVLDGVEISTDDGHYVAVGIPASPYPLAGHASAVVEDVARLGGVGIVAHPFHPNPELAWQDWDLPFDGMEWINADVEWRNESTAGLTRVLLAYWLRPAAAVASLFDRPTAALARWDEISGRRSVLGLAGADAHGNRLGGGDEGSGRFAPGPAYEASLSAFSNRVILTAALSGDAAADARLVFEALRAGRSYVVIDGIGDGILLDHGSGGFSVAAAPKEADVRVLRSDGRTRLEVALDGAPGEPPVPWAVSNWAGEPAREAVPSELLLPATEDLRPASAWRVEKDEASEAEVAGGDRGVTLRYQLAPGQPRSQFAAAAVDLAAGEPFTRLTLGGTAAAPMRVSVQLRYAPDDARWVRSIYLDQVPREYTIELASLRAADRTGRPIPPGTPRSLLLVVDTVNAAPGSEGAFTIHSIRVAGSS